MGNVKFGIKDEMISLIKEVFDRYDSIDKAIIYGSRAKGNYKDGSDIDLTLIGQEIDLTTLTKLLNELDDLLLPYSFDISIYSKITNIDLLEHIKRVGICFYQKSA